MEDFDPYQFIRQLPPYEDVRTGGPPAPVLPALRATRRSAKRATLVLDLDETLVHCTVEPIPNADHVFSVRFNDEDFNVYVRKRPGLDAFLAAVSALFEVVVFTASQRVYAEVLLDMLDPQGAHINHRLYRDACLQVDGNYLKDLNVLGRDLRRVAIVDNSPYAYAYQLANGIPIESWFDDDKDEELSLLLPFLQRLADKDDMRPTIQQTFKTHELVKKAPIGPPL
ncbi:HAD-like domain-containing protein [Tribonema minus]|uniref:HAD-like domain-containing protein n=1 Tax=Tribonema minus TaxID=303371 RepID=A0A836CBU7_9STRA|nr:HAD-like domain-containing protein [Tribonema minus]